MLKSLELRDKNASLHDLGTHHGLWTDDLDPDEEIARLLGYPKAIIPAKLDEPDAIEDEAVEVSRNGEKSSLTLAREATELPADVALNTNREHDLERRTESELPQQHEPTPQEFPVASPLTPLNVELTRQDENAPAKNKLQGFKRLKDEKAVARKDNSVEAAQNYAPVSGSRTLV
jgi:hypothetical protein